MKINIFHKGKLPFNPFTELNAGVGSTETTIVHVAAELQKLGHEVTVYCNCNFPDIYNDTRYLKYYDYKVQNEDILIGFGCLPKSSFANSVFIWSTKVEVDNILAIDDLYKIKNLIVSSDWHRDRYASVMSPDIVKKTVVIEPGVTKGFLEFSETKEPLSVAYAGPPQKGGMNAMIEYAKRVKPKNIDVSIHVYGNANLWGLSDEQFRPLYDQLIRAKIYYHGQKGKRKMIKNFGYAQICLNPVKKNYQQAFGLTVLEAMASGCVVIANNNGNIKNLIKDAGYIIDIPIEDYKFAIEATDLTLKLFSNPSLMMEMSLKARTYAKEFTWDKTIEKFLKLV
jgi:glycosyltransferase involved in cell wall biosynthesis